MSLTKNLSQCNKCVKNVTKISVRQISSGSSNALESRKMQAKTVVLTQWKLVSQLKNYLARITPDHKLLDSALNKEFARFLQKVQPSVYGTDLVRYFESLSLPAPKKKPQEGMSIPDVLTGLKIRMGNGAEEVKKPTVPKWKETKVIVSKEAIMSRTEQIISALTTAQSDCAKLSRVEDFNQHIKRYPEAKHHAVKGGAIRQLLKIRHETKDKDVKGAANEALALLGYAHPVRGSGVRVLSIDGGGVRGILVIEMLKKLEELTGRSVHEMFDLICGVSTGAIIASLICVKRISLDEISEIYKGLSTQIFTQSALKGTSNLVWSHSYYDTALWEKLLKEQIGEQTLISTNRNSTSPKLCALSAVVNQSRLSAYIFRNYSLPCRVQSQYRGDCQHKIWEAVRASAAAPTYFEEFKLGNMLHQDGGILFNNPSAVAIHEAKLLWPATPIQCIISFGTGRTVPNPLDFAKHEPANNSSWKNKFYAIIESATDTEGVHTMLSDLLPGRTYYRFNPYLTEMLDIAEIDPEKLEQLKRDAIMYLRRNEDKFQDAAKALSDKKSLSQKLTDWLSLQGEIHGANVLQSRF